MRAKGQLPLMKRRDGSALVIVLGLAFLMTSAGIALTRMSGNTALTARRIQNGVRAMGIAEAGIADAVGRISTNYLGWANRTYTNGFGSGYYIVNTRRMTNGWSVLITSMGVLGDDRRTTVLELLGNKYFIWNDLLSGNCAIISERDGTLETAAPEIHGRVHSNANVLHSRGNLIIDGSVTACGVVQVDVGTGHVIIENAPRELVPTYLPFDAWYRAATNGGLYFASNLTLAGQDLRPGNGVVYVNGDVEVRNKSSIVGTLVATGSITINNHFDQYQFAAGWPAMLAGLDVNMLNRNNYVGVIFAGRNIVTRNNKTIQGSLIALNTVYVENQCKLFPLTDTPIWSPDPDDDATPKLLVGGWLR